MLRAPDEQIQKHRRQIDAFLSEPVVHLPAILRFDFGDQNVVGLEPAQAIGQNIGGDAFPRLLELPERTVAANHEIPDNQQRPAISQDVQRDAHWTSRPPLGNGLPRHFARLAGSLAECKRRACRLPMDHLTIDQSMRSLWTLGGLSLKDLLRRTVCECWEDSVFGQAGLMAFYNFLAIFPALLVLLALSARVPHLGDYTKNALRDLSTEVLPAQVSQLLQQMIGELNGRGLSGMHLLGACAGALWAALNATWAMVYGLNRAYEVEERRSWWQMALTIGGLTLSMALTTGVALFLIFCGAYFETHFHIDAIALRVAEYLILILALSLSFAVLYRFAANVRDHAWRWSTPGALCALLLWISFTLLARVYFDYVNDYSRTYGHLNGVVMLMLWLYASNGAVLIGGEMNSEIEKAVRVKVHLRKSHG